MWNKFGRGFSLFLYVQVTVTAVYILYCWQYHSAFQSFRFCHRPVWLQKCSISSNRESFCSVSLSLCMSVRLSLSVCMCACVCVHACLSHTHSMSVSLFACVCARILSDKADVLGQLIYLLSVALIVSALCSKNTQVCSVNINTVFQFVLFVSGCESKAESKL